MVHSSATQLCVWLLFVYASLRQSFCLWCICVGSGHNLTHDWVPQCSSTQCAQYLGVKGLQLGNLSLPMQLDDSSLLAATPDLIASHFENRKCILIRQTCLAVWIGPQFSPTYIIHKCIKHMRYTSVDPKHVDTFVLECHDWIHAYRCMKKQQRIKNVSQNKTSASWGGLGWCGSGWRKSAWENGGRRKVDMQCDQHM